MNETQLPDPKLDAPPPENTPEKRASLGNRILGYSFLASVVINLGWLAWVSSSNLFGGKAPLDLHPQVIKMVKIAQKPKPKPPKLKPPPPPPPPKQKPPPPLKTPPKIRPKVQPKAQPKVQPRPTPARPTPSRPSPTRPVAVAHSTNSTTPAPAMPTAPPQPAEPVTPGPPEPKTPPAPPAPPTPPTPPTPPAPPAPPKPKPAPPAPPKPDPPKPKGWVPIDVQDAVPIPDPDVSMDGIDQSSLTPGQNVVITYTLDETGHVKNARIKSSCGNSELDNRVLRAIQRGRGAPAIQDHIPRESRQQYVFQING